jgi:hypothetical protein
VVTSVKGTGVRTPFGDSRAFGHGDGEMDN